jgi:hypothetical protein
MNVTLTHSSSSTTYRRGYITAASNHLLNSSIQLTHLLESLEITHPIPSQPPTHLLRPNDQNKQTQKPPPKMPKSTGPLQTHLFGNTTNSTPGMADQPTVAADKIGEKKGTDAIPQSVCSFPFILPSLPSHFTSHPPIHPSTHLLDIPRVC